jgi:photosystem II stability/assembly factor-like uncharacterized protein
MKKLINILTQIILILVDITSLNAQWSQQNSGTNEKLTDIFMLDSVTAIAVGRGRSILRTSDAGKTWKNLTIMLSSVVPWNDVSFFDNTYGIVVGDGAFRITSDKGKSWYQGVIPFNRKYLSSIYLSPGNIYVGDDSGWVHHSLDTGKTWSSEKISDEPVRSLFFWRGPYVSSLPIYALTPSKLYKNQEFPPGQWSEISIPVQELGSEVFQGEFANGGGPGFIVGVLGDKWSQPSILRRLISTETWQSLIIPDLPEGILFGVSIPSEKFVYTCGTNGMIAKSSDGGEFWSVSKVPITKDLNAISFFDNSRGFAVGDSGIILYTENGGVIPEVITEFVPYGLQDKFITSLTAEESDYSDKFSFFKSDYIFAGTKDDGVFRKLITESNNDPQDWTNLGLEGKSITAITVQHWGIGPMVGLRLYAALKPDSMGNDSTLLFSRETSTPYDTNWSTSDSGIVKDANSINALNSYYFTGHTVPMSILAGTDLGIFKRNWTDNFWTQSEIEEYPVSINQPITAIDVSPHWWGNLAWASGSIELSPAAFHSTDNGSTWKAFPLVEIDGVGDTASSVAINTRNPDSVYVSWNDIIFLTPDNGNIWELVLQPVSQLVNINAVTVDRLHPENVYAGGSTSNDDFYFIYSTDGGTNWTPIIPLVNMPIKKVTSIVTKNPNNNSSYVFIGTAGTGVWLLKQTILTSVADNKNIPEGFKLYQNFPNPFNPTTAIKYELPKESNALLVIYNLLGEKVAELVNTFQKEGKYEVDWNASSFASGIYFCRLEASEFSAVKKLILLK